MLKTLRFEALREEHLPSILAIEKHVHSAPWSEGSFRNELTNAHGIFLVALVEGEVCGYGGIWLVIDEAHVTNLAVDESMRRQGIGNRLMVELLSKAKALGMVCSTLEVRATNVAAVSLYEHMGYKQTGVRKGYYPDHNEDAIVMWMYELDQWEPPTPRLS